MPEPREPEPGGAAGGITGAAEGAADVPSKRALAFAAACSGAATFAGSIGVGAAPDSEAAADIAVKPAAWNAEGTAGAGAGAGAMAAESDGDIGDIKDNPARGFSDGATATGATTKIGPEPVWTETRMTCADTGAAKDATAMNIAARFTTEL